MGLVFYQNIFRYKVKQEHILILTICTGTGPIIEGEIKWQKI